MRIYTGTRSGLPFWRSIEQQMHRATLRHIAIRHARRTGRSVIGLRLRGDDAITFIPDGLRIPGLFPERRYRIVPDRG
jgi:hypothetical protein